MIEACDYYAIPSDDIETTRTLIEQALDIQFEPHESDALCGEYYLFKKGKWKSEGGITLHNNQDPIDQEWTLEGAKHCPLVLSVDCMPNYLEIEKILKEKIPGIILVSRDEDEEEE